MERAGQERWLVVNRSPEQLWEPIREFWQESGFLINIDQASIGIIETDWAENRAKIPQDIIRRTLGRILDPWQNIWWLWAPAPGQPVKSGWFCGLLRAASPRPAFD